MTPEIQALRKEIEELEMLTAVAKAAEDLTEAQAVAIQVTVFGPNDTKIVHCVNDNRHFKNALWSDYYAMKQEVDNKKDNLKNLEAQHAAENNPPMLNPNNVEAPPLTIKDEPVPMPAPLSDDEDLFKDLL